VENTAHIFFDYNPAVVTNTVRQTLVDEIPANGSTETVYMCVGCSYTWRGTVYDVPGTYTVSETAEDGCLTIDTLVLTDEAPGELLISPNPTDDAFTIRLPGVSQHTGVELIDLNGNSVYSEAFGKAQFLAIDPSDEVSQGMYFVRIVTEEDEHVVKLIIR
jgi:hypothetical protein